MYSLRLSTWILQKFGKLDQLNLKFTFHIGCQATQDGEKVPVIGNKPLLFHLGNRAQNPEQQMLLVQEEGNLSTIISFHTAMLLPKYLFLELNYPAVVLTTEGQEKVLEFMKRLSGLVSKIGLMAMWVCTANRMKEPHNGRQRQLEASILRQ